MRAPTDENCGLGAALRVIGGKWKATITWRLHERPLRFGALHREFEGISEKVLFEQLRELEDDGVVQRERCERPLSVTYSLTKHGQRLNTAVHALAEWGSVHREMQVPVAENDKAPLVGGA